MNLIKIITVLLSLAVTGIGLRSQAMKNRKRKSVEGLSFPYFLLLAVSYTFWTIHGWIERDYVLIIPMSAGALISWVVVGQFFAYGTRKKRGII
ncbi:MAG TPA: SemiSWEET family transporter [Candidatus Paceibacterota bacterium]|nr:SemiSWEET family transporter [Candidatus Paceibacterota bacterium]